MSFVEDVFKGGNIVTGLAIGLGGIILAPLVAPVIIGVVRPVAKVAIRGGLALYEKGRDVAVEAGEAMSDLVAEARSELRRDAEEHDPFGPP